jgi:hypothetical protein
MRSAAPDSPRWSATMANDLAEVAEAGTMADDLAGVAEAGNGG